MCRLLMIMPLHARRRGQHRKDIKQEYGSKLGKMAMTPTQSKSVFIATCVTTPIVTILHVTKLLQLNTV